MHGRRKLISILLILILALGIAALQPLAAVAAEYPVSGAGICLQQGMQGPQVAELQRKLSNLGYAVGPADGIFGPRTKSAVTAFQADHGLIADGIAGPKTLGAIDYLTDNTGTAEAMAAGGVPEGLTAEEAGMFGMVNQERAVAGLKPLAVDWRLVLVARAKAKDMIRNGYFSHQSPIYGSPFYQMKAAGISYRYAGENLAGAPMLERAHAGLMNSESHRRNILSPNFTHIGIGAVAGGPYGKIFVQLFIGK